jgi:pimeloyl-ACP methyl ester carboxylesterase
MVLTYEGGEYLAQQPTRLRARGARSSAWPRSSAHAGARRRADLPDLRGVADLLATQIPRAEKRMIAGAGHMVNLEQSGMFNALMREFLERVEAQQQATHG